jgi:glycosyltransferase involved in cell wall biosynthesis
MLSRFYANPEQPWHPTIPDPGMVRALDDMVRRFRPDVVHAHSWILFSFLPFLPSRRTSLVVTMHDYGLVCPKISFVHADGVCDGPRYGKCVTCARGQYGALRSVALTTGLAVTRGMRNRVDRYIAVSAPVANACESQAAPGRRPIVVIPPFLADASLEPDGGSRPAFVPATGDYVMFAGSLGPHKGVNVLLDAWSGLGSEAQLVLVGLRRHDTPSSFPEGVAIVENVPHDDVLRAWAHCAVAVVPSTWPDPHPLTAMEAMAAGRPVVASAVGGLLGIVLDGETGILVPPGDASALRDGIRQLLHDPVRRARLGLAGRGRARRYSASVIVPQIERVYAEASGRHDRTRRRRGWE